MGAFEWNAGLVAGVALNARLTFKNVNLAGPVLESCILPQHSSVDPDHGAPDSAATPSHHLLSHPAVLLCPTIGLLGQLLLDVVHHAVKSQCRPLEYQYIFYNNM